MLIPEIVNFFGTAFEKKAAIVQIVYLTNLKENESNEKSEFSNCNDFCVPCSA